MTGKTVEQFKVQLDKYLKSKMGIPIVSWDQNNRQSNRLILRPLVSPTHTPSLEIPEDESLPTRGLIGENRTTRSH